MLAIGLESDAVCEQEWATDAIIIFSQEHFQNLQQHRMMKMALPTRCIHSLNSREMCGGSRIHNSNLNVPLNKGSCKTQICISGLFCPAPIGACGCAYKFPNLCRVQYQLGSLCECVFVLSFFFCLFVFMRHCLRLHCSS